MRIVVFTGDLNYPVRKGIVEIDRHIAGLEWLILVHAPQRRLGKLLRNQHRNLRYHGWRWIPYQACELLRGRRFRGAADAGGGGPGQHYALAAMSARPNVRVLRCADLHADAVLAAVSEFAPTLGLSLGAPLLKAPLFSLPSAGTINLHKGKLPDYRGMPPAFWELWNGESSVGCSVHEVEAGLDTGRVVRQAVTAVQKYSTVRGVQLTLDEVGVDLMRAAVADVLAGNATPVPQPPGGHTYRKPTLAQVAQLRRRLARAGPRAEAVVARWLKGAAFLAKIVARKASSRWTAPRVAVLLFHRVSDEARDNLTVGIEQFERMIALVRRHCQPLSIEQVAAGVMPRPGDRPAVCITFDDGYLDNYEHAVPILLRHQMPAAFFVSTGIVGTDRRFPHDEKRGNPWIPVMNWDQLRRMRDHGFTIGSHSVSHIDCATEPEAKVRAELEQSHGDLQRELALPSCMFAYPYGRRHNMTAERLEIVKAMGFTACLSAYGGVNVGAVDRFNILRTGIHWGFSDLAFLYRCFGFP